MSSGPPTIEALTDPFATLGEGPHWSKEAKCLFYVDILGQRIFRFDPETNENVPSAKLQGDDASSSLSLVVPVEGSTTEFVVAVGRFVCLATWDGLADGPLALRRLHAVDEHSPANRLNDGKCDARGRLWAGTMGPEERPGSIEPGRGALYRVDSRGCKKMVDGVDLSNGIEWSADGRTMYYIDSLRHAVDAFDFDLEEGEVSGRRTVFDLKKNGVDGLPDGMTVDERGHLWVAVFAGSKVIEVLPSNDGGSILGSIDFPEAPNVTSVAFGGENCEDLFVTSARLHNEKKLSGTLFRISKLKSFADGHQCRGRPGRAFDARHLR